jgi:hypothetical protein
MRRILANTLADRLGAVNFSDIGIGRSIAFTDG